MSWFRADQRSRRRRFLFALCCAVCSGIGLVLFAGDLDLETIPLSDIQADPLSSSPDHGDAAPARPLRIDAEVADLGVERAIPADT